MEENLRQLCIQIIEENDAAAVTLGIVRQELEVQYGYEFSHTEIFDLLHEMEDDGDLVYHLGEYNEFAVPD